MKRIGFRGDRSHPFEIMVWEDGKEALVICLDPMQVLHLINRMVDGYASWVADKQFIDRPVDPPSSLEP